MKKPKADCRADTRGGGFAGIPVCVVESAAYRSLSPWARSVLVELAARMRGYNNGRIALSVTEICEAMGNSNRRKATAAIAELIERGLVDMGADAIWKERKAREYRLTFVTMRRGQFIASASNEYLQWTATKKIRGNASSPERCKSGNASSPEPQNAGNTSSPAKFADLRKTAKNGPAKNAVAGDDVSLLINSHGIGEKIPEDISLHERAAIAEMASGHDPLMEGLRAAWAGLPVAKRNAVTQRHALSRDEIEQVLSGRLELPVGKLIALRASAVKMAGGAHAGAA